MSPRATSAARVAEPRERRATAAPRPPLRPVVTPTRRTRPAPTAWQRLRRRVSPVSVAVAIVVACLLAVVVANMELASRQLRLEQVQSELATAQSQTDSVLLQVASKVSPQHVAAESKGSGLVDPSEILSIPSGVSLERREAPPRFSDAPCCTVTPGP